VSQSDVDPDELQAQLDDIKQAMGLSERYPGQGRVWLVYGLLVPGFAFALQLLFVVPLPEWGYVATWLGFLGVGLGSLWWLGRRTSSSGAPAAVPDLRVVMAALVATVGALTVVSQPVLEATTASGLVVGAYFFGLVIALAGLGFLVTGTVLRASRIRRRDRWVFYAGGLWMLVYAALFATVDVLHYAGYGVFGVLSLGQAVLSYLLLTRH
jgi:hypothetical protein